MAPGTPPTKERLQECRQTLHTLIEEKQCNPIFVRIAWHDSGTHDASVKEWPACGGADGSIVHDVEMNHGANAGLPNALSLLQPVKQAFPDISWADIIQMASATAIESAGGPKIPMRYGRLDVDGPEQCPKEGNLPAGAAPYPAGAKDAAEHLRHVFHRMGLNDQEIVALSGAHTLGRAYKDRSGLGKETTKFTDGSHNPKASGPTGHGRLGGQPWTEKWLVFDNSYFTTIPDPDADPDLLKLDTDSVLFRDDGFRPHALRYKESQDVFFTEYAAAHKKLSELGSKFHPEEGITLD